MPKYRRKPEIIEAFRMTQERRASNEEWPSWLNKAWNEPRGTEGALWPEFWPHSDGKDRLILGLSDRTWVVVQWGDYIICGPGDHLYVEDQDFFKKNHEEVGD